MGTGSKGLSSLRERKQKRPALRSSQLSAAKRFVGHYMIGDPCKMQPLHRAEKTELAFRQDQVGTLMSKNNGKEGNR